MSTSTDPGRDPVSIDWRKEEVVAFDLETTGLDPVRHSVVEIACVKFQGGEPRAFFSLLVKPPHPIPAEVTKIHGIGDQDVEDAPPLPSVLPMLESFVGTHLLVAHNAPFDLSFLRMEYARCGRPYPGFRAIDTRLLARSVLPQLGRYSLASLTRVLDIPLHRHHRALSDAWACGDLFYALAERSSGEGPLPLDGILVG